MVVFLHATTSIFCFVSMTALQLLRLSYLGLAAATVMNIRDLQLSNANILILVTLLGIKTDSNASQPLKACSAISTTEYVISLIVIESGISTFTTFESTAHNSTIFVPITL